jgi:hypothetical protein
VRHVEVRSEHDTFHDSGVTQSVNHEFSQRKVQNEVFGPPLNMSSARPEKVPK